MKKNANDSPTYIIFGSHDEAARFDFIKNEICPKYSDKGQIHYINPDSNWDVVKQWGDKYYEQSIQALHNEEQKILDQQFNGIEADIPESLRAEYELKEKQINDLGDVYLHCYRSTLSMEMFTLGNLDDNGIWHSDASEYGSAMIFDGSKPGTNPSFDKLRNGWWYTKPLYIFTSITNMATANYFYSTVKNYNFDIKFIRLDAKYDSKEEIVKNSVLNYVKTGESNCNYYMPYYRISKDTVCDWRLGNLSGDHDHIRCQRPYKYHPGLIGITAPNENVRLKQLCDGLCVELIDNDE